MDDEQDDPIPCAHCGADIPVDEVFWISPEGAISLEGTGDPYHEGCIP